MKDTLRPVVKGSSALITSQLILALVLTCVVRVQALMSVKSWQVAEAAKSGDVGKVKQLLDADPKLVNTCDGDGFTPLHRAAQSGRVEVVELLLARGADINAASKASGLTPIYLAAVNGRLQVIELLVTKGADVNVEGKAGITPLDTAARLNHAAVAEYLLAHGAKLHFPAAIILGKANEIAAMLEAKPGLAQEAVRKGLYSSIWGDPTPLALAASYGQAKVMELLIAKGADVNAHISSTPGRNEDRAGGETALHCAVSGRRLEAIELLLSKGADINAVNQYGDTPLCVAAKTGPAIIVQLLLERGADVNAKGKGGVTPLWAAQNRLSFTGERIKQDDIVELLRQHGAKK